MDIVKKILKSSSDSDADTKRINRKTREAARSYIDKIVSSFAILCELDGLMKGPAFEHHPDYTLKAIIPVVIGGENKTLYVIFSKDENPSPLFAWIEDCDNED